MAQGDTFTSGADGSTAGSSLDKITITAASGTHVAVHAMIVGAADLGSTGGAKIHSHDTGSNTTWAVVGDGSSNEGSWLHVTQTGTDKQTSGKVFIDDTVGLRARFDNDRCSSSDRSYAVHGQVVK